MRPTVRQLEYLAAVAELRSFRRAAESCHVSQPALSAQIQQLERLLGARLFERDRRRVLPTPAGAAAAARAREILERLDVLAASARGLGRPLAGTLRFGVIPTIAPYLLPKALPAVRRRHPELRLQLREEQTDRLVELAQAGSLDLLLLALEAELGSMDLLPLFHDPFLLAAPSEHRLAGRRSVRESDLEGEAVLLLDDGHCLRHQALEVCRRRGGHELADFRASSLPTLVQMVAGGAGVTLLPALAAPALATRGLAVVPFARPAPYRTIGFAFRRSSARREEFQQLAETFRRAAPD